MGTAWRWGWGCQRGRGRQRPWRENGLAPRPRTWTSWSMYGLKWFDHRQEHEGTEDAGSEERNVGSFPRFLAKTMAIEMRDPKCGPGLPVVAGHEAFL